jgi:hypothetical protein
MIELISFDGEIAMDAGVTAAFVFDVIQRYSKREIGNPEYNYFSDCGEWVRIPIVQLQKDLPIIGKTALRSAIEKLEVHQYVEIDKIGKHLKDRRDGGFMFKVVRNG